MSLSFIIGAQLEGSKIRNEEKMPKYPDLGSTFKPLVLESNGADTSSSIRLKSLASKSKTAINSG